jgi:hypothetical protein
MDNYLEYSDVSEARPGDVVVPTADLGAPECYPFSSAVVTKVGATVQLSRPYAEYKDGAIVTKTEIYTIDPQLFCMRFVRYRCSPTGSAYTVDYT